MTAGKRCATIGCGIGLTLCTTLIGAGGADSDHVKVRIRNKAGHARALCSVDYIVVGARGIIGRCRIRDGRLERVGIH
jgi:hypothetical protein